MPGAPAVEIDVPPLARVDLAVAVPADSTVVLTLTEEGQTSLATWTDAEGRLHFPRTNLAGQGASIRFTLAGGGANPQRFTVSSRSPGRESRLLAVASAPRPERPRDAVAMAGEESLAQGEYLWGKHDPRNAAGALSAFDRAIRAWEQLGDIPMLRASLTWKAIYLSFVAGQPRSALPLLLRATSLPDAGDLVEQANSWKTLGFVQTTLADYSAGWEDYAKALRLFRTTGDLFNQEVMLENRGDLSKMTGDYEGALLDATAAAELARRLNDRAGQLDIEDEIGGIQLQRGQMQSAFAAFEQVLGLEKLQPGDPMIGFAETDLAKLYHRLDAPAQARDMLSRADAFWAAHPYMLGQLDTLIDEGEIEAGSGDLPQAAAAYRRGLELAEPGRMKREMVFCLLGLGTVEEKRGEDAAAAASFQHASQLAVAIDESDALARIHTAEGDLALSQGRLAAARQDYRQALDVATQTYDHTETVRALGGLAEAEFRSGDYAAARRQIELALDGIESTRDRIVPGSLQTSYFSSWHSYYALAIRDLMRLAALHPGAGWDREALDTAERGRARFLLEQIEEGGASAEMRADPVLAASRSRTLRELRLAESTLVALRTGNGKSTGNENSARVEELQSRVAGLKEREDRIEAAVYHESSAGRSLETAAAARSLSGLLPRIQSRLGPHTTLLEYWTDKHVSYLWAIGARSLRAFTLPGTLELRPLASKLSAELISPFARTPASVEQFAASLLSSTASFDATSARLARLILPPHSIPAGTHTLLVVGDGPLLSIPFGALRIASPVGPAYLQGKYTVVSEPSIGVLLALLAHPQPSRPMKVAVIADPVFSTADPRFGGRIVPVDDAPPGTASDGASLSSDGDAPGQADWISIAGVDHLRRLPFAGREAEEIASLAGPGRSYLALGFTASVQRVRSIDWANYTIAHFATHAFMNPQHPELAGVALSLFNSSGKPQPGLLWYSDISSLHMPLQLVVLSACRTANGDPMPGEGLVGLSYAFFLAGAHRVVGSLWNADDEATAALMRRFYAAMFSGAASPADALRTAQREMAATPRWSDPYYWAGFTIEGDWRPLPR